MHAAFITLALLAHQGSFAQTNSGDSIVQKYRAEQKILGNEFASHFFGNFSRNARLTERAFVAKVDSSRNLFVALLKTYEQSLDPAFVSNQEAEIKYYFDKLILDYPAQHEIYSGAGKTRLSQKVDKRLSENVRDFNRPELLSNADFRDYVKAYLEHRAAAMTESYQARDNKRLVATWTLIQSTFSNPACREFWQYDYLYNHIDNNGIKNIQALVDEFRLSCHDITYVGRVNRLYAEDSAARADHLIRTYKTVDGYDLDIHIFLPSDGMAKERPVFVYFHGGSWSEGKPDWGFSACKRYASKGWVAVAVEYRVSSRHATLPFESVMDARSAIRWLRKNASEYGIDPARIVVTGNSAGGHLALATALADKWNERSDDLQLSPVPNFIMVNAAVYDLTVENTTWIAKGLKDKNVVKEISPNHLLRKNMPPVLAVHGTRDLNCPYETALSFKKEMQRLGNDCDFLELEGATHFIWVQPQYSERISTARTAFLQKWGLEN